MGQIVLPKNGHNISIPQALLELCHSSIKRWCLSSLPLTLSRLNPSGALWLSQLLEYGRSDAPGLLKVSDKDDHTHTHTHTQSFLKPNHHAVRRDPWGSEEATSLPASTNLFSVEVSPPLQKGLATQSSILAWKIPSMDRGAWQATVHRVLQRQTQLKWLSA